jgi:hypothetical protein
MKRFFDFLDIASSFLRTRREPDLVEDPTHYKIKTRDHDYAGRILFQDNRLIILKTIDLKVVKILKGNIQKIK